MADNKENTVYKGSIRRWFPSKGFGFVSKDDGSGDVFAHISSFCGHLSYIANHGADMSGIIVYLTQVLAPKGPKADTCACRLCFQAAVDTVVASAATNIVADRMMSLFEGGLRLDLGGKVPYYYRFDRKNPPADMVLYEFESSAMRAILDGGSDEQVIRTATDAAKQRLRDLFSACPSP
jgi:hypothetical protein